MLKTLKIENLKGADYNPRTIAEPQLEQLCESIKKLGVIKPVILNGETNVLLAGHQRTRSMKKLGMTETPGFVLMGIKKHDEVRFNQYHNMVEVDVEGKAPEILLTTFEEIPLETHHVESWKNFKVINNGKMATMYLELSKMILRYGDFANAIIDHEGRVIVGAAYCMASLKLRRDIYVYRLNQEQSEFANRVFHLEYGSFSYKHIDKNPYIHTLAQKARLRRPEVDNKFATSSLYELCVLPELTKELRVLDFGAGQMDYHKMLKAKGFKHFALEFYLRHEGHNAINNKKVERHFRDIMEDIRENGLFDVVVCDSVLNSIHEIEAEQAVIVTLNAFCKFGGRIFYSGRNLEAEVKRGTIHSSASKQSYLKFLDHDYFSGIMRNGEWFFQKLHTNKQFETLAFNFHGTDGKLSGPHLNCQMSVTKSRELPEEILREALKYEFSLPLPNNQAYTLYQDNPEFFDLLIQLNKCTQQSKS